MVRLQRAYKKGSLVYYGCAFNPTMVRLQPLWELERWCLHILSIPLWCDCNHHSWLNMVRKDTTFNPTMVRLQQAQTKAPARPTRAFQSHYGAIATFRCWGERTPCFSFQSHYGAIATHDISPRGETHIALSIPLWCDCNEESRMYELTANLTFNPTMVRLQLQGREGILWERKAFNPTMVRLQRVKGRRERSV